MNLEELQAYANKHNLNLGQAEKDYFQNLLLFILYQKAGKELVFKGGTALSKCYGLNRFSEDLDFDTRERVDYIPLLKKRLEEFGINFTLKDHQKHPLGESIRVKIQGPLYKGHEHSLCSITLDLSDREVALLPPLIRTIGHHMDILPAFDVYVMDEKEIMTEKTHAILARHSARDLYDLRYLIEKKVEMSKDDMETKLAARSMAFDFKQFEKRCREIKPIWESELKSLVRNVPPFDETIQKVLEYYKKL